MKKTLIFLVALCSCICASAQKPVVVVDHFTSTTCKAGDLENLRNQVITGIYETGSVTLVDIEAESTMTMEAERRSSELSLADETARIGIMKTLGANYVLTGTASKLSADKKSGYDPIRRPAHYFKSLSMEEKNEIIKKDPRFGRNVCRCEGITEGEIVEAIHTNPGATDVDGIKRRTRSGMGRCQGGFCSPIVVDIIAREKGISLEKVTKFGKGSVINYEKTKGDC